MHRMNSRQLVWCQKGDNLDNFLLLILKRLGLVMRDKGRFLFVRSNHWVQFLNGTHEFSELVAAKMALLMDQSRSVLPLRWGKAREFGELWREKLCARALLTFN